ncbi:LptF/LptG family permease [Nonlabens antarcticus]|uniref:LptF/LptG family permease n=1 Tax=Nonlabens antarcticus TaxID=392714 RepID=UPI0018917D3B|nr:LptF/LptG family permease [Nonlabens antarcticus]
MKILDRYILTQFIKTFLSVFIVLMFILILQAIWLYIKDIAGKDIDAITIVKFMMYTIPVIVPLALPLSILLASIMVFGNMAENYEFAAMKSNGISLQRAMLSLIIVIFSLGITSFIFANTVIPWGNLKQRNLRRNIAQVKPAMAISENVFNQLGDINIKVSDKSGEKGEFLTDVIIHQKSPRSAGNFKVIKAEKGELKSSLKSDVIQLVLYNGNYYEDLFVDKPQKRASSPFVKSYFDVYTLNQDVSALNDVDMDSESVTDDHQMLKINELQTQIDSFSYNFNNTKEIHNKNQWLKWSPDRLTERVAKYIDTTTNTSPFFERLSITEQRRSLEDAINKVTQQKYLLRTRKDQLQQELVRLNKYEIEIHKKFVLGVACIILFFIGAPLGAIIRKGGMGLPLVIATIFFLTYHFIGIFAEKASAEGAFPAWIGAWLSTAIIFPIGIFLTYRATTDQGFFNINFTFSALLDKFKKKPKLPPTSA